LLLGINESKTSTPYDCGTLYPGVNGNLGGAPNGNVNFTVVNSQGVARDIGTGLNPFYGAAAIVVDDVFTNQDPEFVILFGANRAILLWCEMEFLDVAYSVVGGEINIMDSNRSSSVASYALSGPIASQTSRISQLLWFSAEMNAVSDNSTLFSSLFSKDLSRITMALNSGIVIKSSTTSESLRTPLLASRIPKAPLFAFIVTLSLYVILNAIFILMLASILVFQPKDQFGSRITPRQLDIVKARLHDPLSVVHECFGVGTQSVGKEMFQDITDGVLRIASLAGETGKALVLEHD
jgi:hypothetical protein